MRTILLSLLLAMPAVAAEPWWSLRPLNRPQVPAIGSRQSAIENPIDTFILTKLNEKGLKPSPPAEKAVLIRRLTFDLHGLPPTPDEINAFVNDPSPDAYEKVVDRLLASPRYGERWGRHWLDVVHYGDTHGYDKDKRRDHAWPYRDYVIRSLNQDKPYGRFIREQIAGDALFPNDPDGAIATGFVVAGPWDFVGHVELREGTVDKEKTRAIDRDDMVANTISSFMSLTAHCARCHNHKFDPIPVKDYYRLQAVFAGVERGERGYGDAKIEVERRELDARRVEAQRKLDEIRAKIAANPAPNVAKIDQQIGQTREALAKLPPIPPGIPSPSNGYHSGIEAKADVTKWVQVDLGKPLPIDEVRLMPARPTDFPDTPGFGFPRRFLIQVSDAATFAKAATIADHSNADFANPGDETVVVPAHKTARFVRVTATALWPRTNDYVFALAELQVISGGKNVAAGATVAALDSIEAGRWSTRYLVDDFSSRQKLPDLQSPAIVLHQKLQTLEKQRERQIESNLDPKTRRERDGVMAEVRETQARIKALPALPQVYAVVSRAPRRIYVLKRGDVEKPEEPVSAGGLSCVTGPDPEFNIPDTASEGKRRAALADWIADARNPLTWRSIANRLWHYHFGKGLVDTPNDFGRNGNKPSHPELLDWLACELRDNGGSLKRLQRLIVTSATYCQASRHDESAARIDSDNRLLWRMNRSRLDAESLRDTVLAVSGKLNSHMGGPGFELFRFKDDHSPVYDHLDASTSDRPEAWRRTVYRFTVRSVPNPLLECLDCADPSINTPVRNTTLTALQALALLNDPFMVRQTEYFALRLQQAASGVGRQIDLACRLALGRRATADEIQALTDHVRRHGLANTCRLLFNLNEFTFVD
jgi:Protein of unknown function (DUF1553)/Protein of unknown function (DUF1549)/F5/8 type C domain